MSAPPRGLRQALSCVPWPRSGSEGHTLFFEGDDLYNSMVSAIAAARRQVDLEAYIFSGDEIGWCIGKALAERARAGVAVRLHIDAAGSLFSFSRDLEAYLRQSGVKVRRFHRWTWRRPLRFYRRNHRKLLVIDEQQAYLGGFNIHRESSRAVSGARRWRDTHVLLPPTLGARAATLFVEFWAGRAPSLPVPAPGDVLLPNHSRACRYRVHCMYVALLRRARTRISITTPYFIPDHRTQRELVRASARGVDVRLLLPDKSDVPITRWAARAAYQTLLRAGVRIFEYQPRMLHAKTAVVDSRLATVGTANLDYRSLFVNYELNLFSADRGLCLALERQFATDLKDSLEVTPSLWAARPWSGVITETLGWLGRRWL